jgi:hypothetical protein
LRAVPLARRAYPAAGSRVNPDHPEDKAGRPRPSGPQEQKDALVFEAALPFTGLAGCAKRRSLLRKPGGFEGLSVVEEEFDLDGLSIADETSGIPLT